ncbi:hypothetical protein N9934_02220 [Desulfosarcina sp.]|nr:hypothetical protein [Desulfosarcina sp.]
MFTIQVKQQLIDYCQEQVLQYNFGKRKVANGSNEQQLTGIIGQSVLMQLFGLGKVDGIQGFDNGIDILFNHKKIDVKTMGKTTDVKSYYTNNFLKLQDYFDTEIYIFCSYHKTKKEITVCGWITKDNFVLKRRFYKKGSTRTRSNGTRFTTFSDLYEIDTKDLNNVNSIEELKRQLLKV